MICLAAVDLDLLAVARRRHGRDVVEVVAPERRAVLDAEGEQRLEARADAGLLEDLTNPQGGGAHTHGMESSPLQSIRFVRAGSSRVQGAPPDLASRRVADLLAEVHEPAC